MRLIDADALEDEFGISDADILAKECIREAQTVDAVPVVRCKDCVSYGVGTNNGKPRSYDCSTNGPYDFCSKGFRKDDTND